MIEHRYIGYRITKYIFIAIATVALIYSFFSKGKVVQTFEYALMIYGILYIFLIPVLDNKDIYTGASIIKTTDSSLLRGAIFFSGLLIFFGAIYRIVI